MTSTANASAYEKGNALEEAVRAIEGAIIRSFPGFSESTFRIEGKKVVVIGGVRHEIDVYVSVALGPGYETLFIFECKNWQDKVGKNEIIVLSEKVKALAAQRGFFVAKSYTADAIAQSNLDSRIELLAAVELDPTTVAVPAGFHLLQIVETQAEILVCNDNSDSKHRVALDLETTFLVIDGELKNLGEYGYAWIEKARQERCRTFPSLTLEGEHILEFHDTKNFVKGQATVDGRPVSKIDLKGTVKVQVSRAIVLSVFEVASRGRVIHVQIEGQQVQIRAEFVQVHEGCQLNKPM